MDEYDEGIHVLATNALILDHVSHSDIPMMVPKYHLVSPYHKSLYWTLSPPSSPEAGHTIPPSIVVRPQKAHTGYDIVTRLKSSRRPLTSSYTPSSLRL